jgi:predicted AlkP superfamily phosphohydrolase/phosphomutase
MRYNGVDDYRGFLERMEAGIPTKVAWTRELLERGGWDLFVQVFTEPHCAGHQTWHLHDTSHPAHDPAIVAELGDPMLRAYQALDAAVGELVDAAGEADVLIWSGHGMDYWRGAQFLLKDILVRLGVTHLPPGETRAPRESPLRRLASGAWRALPEFLQAPVRRARANRNARRKQVGAPRQTPKLTYDFDRSLCFPVSNGMSVGGIRLNLVGREPDGRLRPGAETDAFIAGLTADLLAIVDERTGRPAIQRVIRSSDVYEGRFIDRLPDLLVEWSDDVPTGSTIVGEGAAASVRLSSTKIGAVEGTNSFGRTGGHRNEGFFMLAGQGVEPGRLEAGVSLMDLAPTMAAMVGAEMEGADGRVVPEFLGSVVRPATASV